jgi:hypothetical protein
MANGTSLVAITPVRVSDASFEFSESNQFAVGTSREEESVAGAGALLDDVDAG